MIMPCLVACCFCSIAATADDKLPPPPPFPQSQDVAVTFGETKEIKLVVTGRIVEPLTFLVRKPPRLGTLSEIRATSRTTGSVFYSAPPSGAATMDSFSFAAKSADSPVSASASVRLALADRPAELVAPATVDFGSVFLGESSQSVFVLRNVGGSMARGSLEAPAPWAFSKGGAYRIKAGGSQEVAISFSPVEARAYTGRLALGNETLLLQGVGTDPISVSPALITLSGPERQQGKVSFQLKNESPTARTVEIAWPQYFEGSREVLLAPQAEIGITGQLREGFLGASQEAVVLKTGSFRTTIAMNIFPAPAKLKVLPEGGFHFDQSHASPHKLVLSNEGGVPAAFRIAATDGITFAIRENINEVAPGETLEILVSLAPTVGQDFQGKLEITPQDSGPISIPVTASKSVANPISRLLNIPPEAVNTPAETALSAPLAIEKAHVVLSTAHEVEILWKAPDETTTFHAERGQLLGQDDGPVTMRWVTWPGVKFRRQEGSIAARFENLPAGAQWIVRLVPGDSSVLKPSPAFRIQTAEGRPFAYTGWLVGVAMLALIGLAFFVRHRRRQRLLAQYEKRIDRLDNE